MPSKENEEEDTESNFEDEYANPVDSMVESSRKRKVKKFDFVTKEGEHVHLTAEKIKEQKRIEVSLKADLDEHNEEKVEELIDLISYNIVAKYYKNKLLYDKYCDQMLNRRKSSKITNCEILTRRGPITLKVHREDGTTEVISNFKTSDLNLDEWKEVKQACPNQEGKMWKTIYKQINPKMDFLHQAEDKLKIDFNNPLKEQYLLDELNSLASKKRKGADDLLDSFRSTKRLKSSVQYRDHPPGTVLNEHVLGIILFNSVQRQVFVTIEDLEDISDEMIYTT
ncbi:hypothetical protein Tco_1352926 [Tanacetum coccineum]